jgi:hypothetical protein
MANGGRRGISSNSLITKTINQRTNMKGPLHLGRGMEADCHVEERAPQPTGVVYLPGHLQHRGHFAHPLHPVFPKDRAAGFGGQNVSRPGGLPA